MIARSDRPSLTPIISCLRGVLSSVLVAVGTNVMTGCTSSRPVDSFQALSSDREPLRLRGFRFIGWETFVSRNRKMGDISHRVAVYQNDAFYRSIDSLRGGERAIDAEFVLLPPDGRRGHVRIGSDEGFPGFSPRRTYDVDPFLVARTEVSQRVFHALGGSHDPFDWRDPLQPANRLSWHDAVLFCGTLGLALPDESDWEYACGGGAATAFCFGDELRPDEANAGTSDGMTVRVGSLPANAFGLYEVHGNLLELCANDFVANSAGAKAARGGSLYFDARDCASARRRYGVAPHARSPELGFRPICRVPSTTP